VSPRSARARSAPRPDARSALREAQSAIERGDHGAAVAGIAAAWTATPSPRLAAVAARVARHLPAQPLPSAVAAREAVWLALAATRDPGALPTLLAADWPVHPRAAKVRLAALVQFAPEPRIAEALVAL
jgi:hypothetical protein